MSAISAFNKQLGFNIISNTDLAHILIDYAGSNVWAYVYARDIIRGRWAEVESYIMENVECAYWYARDVIKGKWPEAEPIIYLLENKIISGNQIAIVDVDNS